MPSKSGQSGHHKKGGPKTEEQREDAQARFLSSFAEMGTITHAAKASEIARQTHYDWLGSDPAYAEKFKEAAEQATIDMVLGVVRFDPSAELGRTAVPDLRMDRASV